MTIRWLTFFSGLLGLLGLFTHVAARQPKQATRDDEFRRRQREIQQAQHTDYME